MENFDMIIPIKEYNRLKEVESRYNKGEIKVEYIDRHVKTYEIDIRFKDLFNCNATILEKYRYSHNRDIFYIVRSAIEYLVEDTIKKEYEKFKLEFEQKIKKEYENDLVNLSFYQKLKNYLDYETKF